MSEKREIRAMFDEATVRCYQAYEPVIGRRAVRADAFVPPFSRSRMTWLKPSFLWMMYRSDWGRREGQQVVLAIDIVRSEFDALLAQACVSSYDPALFASEAEFKTAVKSSDVRVQWDPERDAAGRPQEVRSLQLGVRGAALHRYLDQGIAAISDVTPFVVSQRDLPADERCKPNEEWTYPVNAVTAARLGMMPRAIRPEG